MKALVYKRLNSVVLEDRPLPSVQKPTDAIVKLTYTTICGTDLHIIKGDVPTCEHGRILGHEGVGIIDKIGDGVRSFEHGDRVLVSCISACGTCEYCRKGMTSHCTTGGWILGNTIDGTQAEYVRIPNADSSLHHIPDGLDEKALVMLSDILPTGLECGVLNGKVQPGGTVVIVGSGPIGLAALMSAQLYSPSLLILVDKDANRLKAAKQFGAHHTVDPEHAEKLIKDLTFGKGCDTVIEAVGIPESFQLCQDLVAPGGIIANIGVHGTKVDLHLEKLWDRNICTFDWFERAFLLLLIHSSYHNEARRRCNYSHAFKIGLFRQALSQGFNHPQYVSSIRLQRCWLTSQRLCLWRYVESL